MYLKRRETVAFYRADQLAGLSSTSYAQPCSISYPAVDAVCRDGTLFQATRQPRHSIKNDLLMTLEQLPDSFGEVRLAFVVPEHRFNEGWCASMALPLQLALDWIHKEAEQVWQPAADCLQQRSWQHTPRSMRASRLSCSALQGSSSACCSCSSTLSCLTLGAGIAAAARSKFLRCGAASALCRWC